MIIIYLREDVSLGSLRHNIVLQDPEAGLKEPRRVSLKAMADNALIDPALASVFIQGLHDLKLALNQLPSAQLLRLLDALGQYLPL